MVGHVGVDASLWRTAMFGMLDAVKKIVETATEIDGDGNSRVVGAQP